MNQCCNQFCKNQAQLQCPECKKFDFPQRYFCSQECFKNSFELHSIVHKFNNVLIWKNYSFSGPVKHHYISQKNPISENIVLPDYANVSGGISLSEENTKHNTLIKEYSGRDIDAIRRAGKLTRIVLNEGKKVCKEGNTTDEIDRVIHEKCEELGVYPSPLNYYGFPKSCCTSVNEVVCHGIPDQRELENGDICNIDVSVFTDDKKHGDCSESLAIGKINEEDEKLMNATKLALKDVIDFVKPGMLYREIGKIIEKRCKNDGFDKGIVREFGGHGIGNLFHTSPRIAHYANNKTVGKMKEGHVFCVEPMINAGKSNIKIWPDQWTVTTVDGSKSCQFEHMILVTDNGCEVLTKDENDVVLNCQ